MKQFGIIGYPLLFSFSKNYFEEKFAKENLQDCSFELFPIENVELFTEIIASNKNLQGLAVTIPHKQAVMPLLTHISDAATAIGAVNCIKIFDGKTIGYNTDVIGFEKSLLPLLQSHHTKALVLGTGGASKAVQYVLKKLYIPFLLVSRNKTDNTITYENISAEIIQTHALIINTTPIYKPEKTLFLQKGEEQGCVIKNGFEMLILQAEENWEIWNC
jgi:shikimate dehydrogenase